MVLYLWSKARWCFGDALLNYMWLLEVMATNISTGKKNKLSRYTSILSWTAHRRAKGKAHRYRRSSRALSRARGGKYTWKSRSDKPAEETEMTYQPVLVQSTSLPQPDVFQDISHNGSSPNPQVAKCLCSI